MRGQVAVAALIAAALVTALPIRPALDSELRAPVIAAALLAGWTLVRAVPLGSLSIASGEAALLAGLAVILILCRRLDRDARQLTLGGLLTLGVLLAITSWVGVAWHLTPLALTSEGLWRGASTITYANAFAGVLVPLALTALALLSAKERSVPLALVVTASAARRRDNAEPCRSARLGSRTHAVGVHPRSRRPTIAARPALPARVSRSSASCHRCPRIATHGLGLPSRRLPLGWE